MITYKVTPSFTPEWQALYASLFPNKEHDASFVSQNYATFSFNDETVNPTDLGPLVKVEEVKL